MSASRRTLMIDETSSQERLLLAAELLDRCEADVVLNGAIAIHCTADAVLCEVMDPTPGAHRCAEEFKVLVENAARDLAQSKLAPLLPNRPLRWVVVDDHGTGTVQLWPTP
jgi:hypothetical protein